MKHKEITGKRGAIKCRVCGKRATVHGQLDYYSVLGDCPGPKKFSIARVDGFAASR